MRTGIVISTYNQPNFLRLVLDSLLLQTRLPDQLLIADDGSGSDTKLLIDEFLATSPFPVEHCWQKDRGFRKSRILNEAIRHADVDYLVFSDGDMLLHPRYFSDHCELATPGRYTQGRRICLNQSSTRRHLDQRRSVVNFWQRGLNRRAQMLRSRRLMKWFSGENSSLTNSRGCNQAFWRQDLVDVNGYEESMEGWGREDSELCARIHNLGRQRIYARHWALAFHLNHPELSREHDRANSQVLNQTIEDGNVRARKGISENTSQGSRVA